VDEGKHLTATKQMLEKTWQPRDGGRNAKSNPRPTKPKLDALKIKSINNIQELNIFNKFYQFVSRDIEKIKLKMSN
jgi:hypothetical protein